MKHKWNHENDTDDIPTGQDPTGFVQLKNKNKKHHHHSHMPGRKAFVQLSDDRISHENDTDDVGYEPKVSNAYESYDNHHTKEWNEKVNQKAIELEN